MNMFTFIFLKLLNVDVNDLRKYLCKWTFIFFVFARNAENVKSFMLKNLKSHNGEKHLLASIK